MPAFPLQLQRIVQAPLSGRIHRRQLAIRPAMVAASQQLQALEAEVQTLHRQAQELNKMGRVNEAAATYKKMAALDDQALQLVLAMPAHPSQEACQQHAAEHPDYCALHCPEPWRDAGAVEGSAGASSQRSRAKGAVLGAAVADAAAMGVHWVYDLEALGAIEAELMAAGAGGLEFAEPPRSPYYSYPSGRPSPYGEQTLVLLRSLAEAGGLDCRRYAEANWAAFGAGFDGYRDVSTKAFLRRYASGLLPPLTGAPSDDQANAFTRLPPLVAVYAGDTRLGRVVEAMVRVTQNDHVAVAYGLAAAAVLEQLILGEPSVTAAVQHTVRSLQGRCSQQAQRQQQQQDRHGAGQREEGCISNADNGTSSGVLASRVSPELAGEVAGALLRVLDLAPVHPRAATSVLGRNCHLPTSLLTALHILLYLEACALPAAAGTALEAAVAAGSSTQQAQPSTSAAHSAAGVDASDAAFCLPCSLGGPQEGGQCAVQPQPTQGQQQQQQRSGAAVLAPSEDAYIAAVRAALREGGCCASRAAYVGACAGALGGEGVIPRSWRSKFVEHGEVAQLTEALCCLRD